MKARVIATGEIIEVSQGIYSPYQYVDDNGTIYTEEDLEILQEVPAPTIDYWTRLEHQYAGMAMQQLVTLVNVGYEYVYEETAIIAMNFAHALVEKYKKEEK